MTSFRARAFVFWSAFLCIVWLGPAAQAAETRRGIALVIGEVEYRHLTRLDNPRNDAIGISALLTQLGFEVSATGDLDAVRLRRKLKSFIIEAEDYDVALIYYSGHAVEAGGSNYLVPVDADAKALDDPQKRLIELMPILEELRQKVPISLIFLDACRTSPFPKGARLVAKKTKGAQPVGATGLSARGLGSLGPLTEAGNAQRTGDVIAFAAAPGQAALDGPAGDNSPYAKAILKHLSVTSTYDFSQIMAMVTGEVYLTTQGQQRPWTNASLSSVLFFGGATPSTDSSVEGEIKTSRRQLLLQVASTPDQVQKILEDAANKRKLPLAWLYDAQRELAKSGRPVTFDALQDELRQQADVIAKFTNEHGQSGDPKRDELLRLAGLAIDEGALPVARKIMDKAVGLTIPLAEMKKRELASRREEAIVYEARGEVLARSSQYREAADDFDTARQYMLDVDPASARKYRFLEADMLRSDGEFFGTAASLAEAARIYDELRQELAGTDIQGWSIATNRLANVEAMTGKRANDGARIARAIGLYAEALARVDRQALPEEWAKAQNNIGSASLMAWDVDHKAASLDEAMKHFRNALEIWTRDKYLEDWARVHHNLGKALVDADLPDEAMAEFKLALEGRAGAAASLDWAASMNGLAAAYALSGDATRAAESYDKAAARIDAKSSPLAWAVNRYNFGQAYLARYQVSQQQGDIRKALAAWTATLDIRPESLDSAGWAATVAALADGYLLLAQETGEDKDATQALDYVGQAKGSALARTDRAFRAKIGNTEGDALTALYEIREDKAEPSLLDAAVASYQDSKKNYLQIGNKTQVAVMELNLAYIEHLRARKLGSPDKAKAALEQADKALAAIRAAGKPAQWQIDLRDRIEKDCACR